MRSINTALKDITAGINLYALVGMLGFQDIRQRYRRSAVGPFWITISTWITIGTIGAVFSQVLKSPLHEFFPFLAVGMILWVFISTVVVEGCIGFIGAESIIKQLPLPLFVHILRMMWRNILILMHNIVILPFFFMMIGQPLNWISMLCIPGFLLVLMNLTWVVLLLGIICARYRDLPQMIGSLLQILFYLTPIIWMPNLLSQRIGLYLLDFNPLYHLLEVTRAPLLGEIPSMLNWVFGVVLAFIGWGLTLMVYGRYKRRIPYWL
jgi:ABC-type polysaccharide/polyol phosphate export permease